ncbi:MAG: diacylglycerol kinase family protein [Niabella sp.]
MAGILKSFVFAFDGIKQAILTERNYKIHIVIALLAILFCNVLPVTRIEVMVVLLCIAMVMAFELMNTAIEKLCDLLHPNKHEQIKLVKDMCAAAVLVTSVTALLIGGIIFIPKLIALF